ncbi:PQQ-dependent sugar dehydrogenase [Natrinema zhouii]|uniref:PQQ-dependent sugar dehydrogenase n=1 Tax=Natrinema zhouii TaxID=1710539 RepID=A0A7D6GQA3_9EURY|nr:PQQ-dependent sugar dehydrogenase [Natrinema zhouii]QLK26541.1 PQQ-dependent sugar dehydrogenase [Natrinema zhouii]
MTRNDDSKTATSRRRILRSTAALSVAGVALPATAQDDAITGEIELGGRTSGWVGISPDAITDERNPTLQLVAGEEYTLTWENQDGAGHNFIIEGEDEEENYVATDVLSDTGETQTVEFTAEEGMSEYYCGPHPQSMRGAIEFADDATDGEETDESAPLIGEGPTVGLETVTDDLTAPVTLQVADEEADRRFIVDQTGYIYVHGEDGLQEEPFLDVSDQLVEFQDFDERGLLGLAFHPDFQENGRFFVRYSSPPREGTPEEYDHTFVLSEFQTADDDHSTADPDSERTILEIPEPQFNHNSGPIAFGPDGYLYVPTGDGGGANDTDEGHVEDWYDENDGGNGQDTEENLLGAILRLDVDVESDERAYGIPDDNPLVDAEGHHGEYYAWGMRNPWGGMSFTGDGEFLMADVGQELFESVNHVQQGGNYSWNVKEGAHCFSTENPTEPPEDCPDSTPDDVRGGEELLDPVIEYPHDLGILESDGAESDEADDGAESDEADDGEETASTGEPVGVSITGGYLYEGGEIDDLEGTYIFGDWSQDGEGPGTLFLARPPEGWPDDGDGDDLEDMFLDPPTDDGDDGNGGNETETSGNETDIADNETAANGGDELHEEEQERGGNETESDEAAPGTTQEGLWPIERLQVQGSAAENGRPTGFVYGFGQGADGELYVLTTSTSTVEGDGAVHRIVPADETDDEGDTDADATEEDSPEVEREPETEEEAEANGDNETEADDDNETAD